MSFFSQPFFNNAYFDKPFFGEPFFAKNYFFSDLAYNPDSIASSQNLFIEDGDGDNIGFSDGARYGKASPNHIADMELKSFFFNVTGGSIIQFHYDENPIGGAAVSINIVFEGYVGTHVYNWNDTEKRYILSANDIPLTDFIATKLNDYVGYEYTLVDTAKAARASRRASKREAE